MKKYILISATLILLIAGCKKDTESLSFSDFPLKQGDMWVYTRLGDSSKVVDTVTLSIASVYSSNDTTFYLWTQTNPYERDTLLSFYINNLFISIPPPYTATFPLLDTMQFPVADGWANATEQYFWYDHSIQVNNVNYNTCFRLGEGSENMYIVSSVGLIRYDLIGGPVAYVKYTSKHIYEWDLLSYHLN